MTALRELLSARGALARAVPGFIPRPAQQEMAERVAETLEAQGILLCEAGTGTGKTYAYLVPSLTGSRRVIVSTGTRALQEQLFHRDLPTVRRALGRPVTVAMLKGRANYLCRYRLERHGGGRYGQRLESALLEIRAWADRTRCGDVAEVVGLPEDAAVWPLVTSTADNCLGQECPHLGDCFVLKARREAAQAEILVINHHLFLADAILRREGFGEVLPGADAVIFDEAHQLPEVALRFFGESLSARQLRDLSRDTITAHTQEAGDLEGIDSRAAAVERAVARFRLALGVAPRRMRWAEAAPLPGLRESLQALKEGLAALGAHLEGAAGRGRLLSQCARRAIEFGRRLEHLTVEVNGPEGVRWVEPLARGFVLHLTPAEVAHSFRQCLEGNRSAWVFTSATLAVGGCFDYFKSRLGLEGAEEARWDSPFDFERQALMYLPELSVDPGDIGYTEAVVEAALPVLAASRGRAFVLFTSHRALAEAAPGFLQRCPYPLLVQGQAPRSELLRCFREGGNRVLLGTQSFWEGVDVRGDALSCVIIDKLPFASPEDPVVRARIEAHRRAGRDPFIEVQLPEAIMALKQGVGRLVRDANDHGVLVLCDPRLCTRPYGRRFFGALPPMRRTRMLQDVVDFFRPPRDVCAAACNGSAAS